MRPSWKYYYHRVSMNLEGSVTRNFSQVLSCYVRFIQFSSLYLCIKPLSVFITYSVSTDLNLFLMEKICRSQWYLYASLHITIAYTCAYIILALSLQSTLQHHHLPSVEIAVKYLYHVKKNV